MQAQRSLGSIEIEKDELNAILGSRYFSRSPSLAHFLSYICEKYFQGESHQIKEYSIAVDAFGRSADFHPKEDPIVRVEASRLRKRLKEYYGSEGSHHSVQLTLPPGQYVPVFQYLEQPEVPSAHEIQVKLSSQVDSLAKIDPTTLVVNPKGEVLIPDEQPIRSRRRMLSLVWLAIGIILGGCIVFWLPRIQHQRRQPESASTIVPQPTPLVTPGGASGTGGEVRIRVGSLGKKYIDQLGKIWDEDRFFTGGVTFGPRDVAILNTRDAAIYQTGREGDFRYDIPLQPGSYELRLHFAETTYGIEEIENDGETMRLISATANGKSLFNGLDVVSDASGSRIADVKIFTGITPADDGLLHLHLSSNKSRGLLNGIEIVPDAAGLMHPVRIVAGDSPRITAGEKLWHPDRYFRGGRKVTRTNAILGTAEPDLFSAPRSAISQALSDDREGSSREATLQGVNTTMFKTLEWTQDGVVMIDQRKLPGEELYPVFKTYQEVAQAIRDMVVRGAPAIGVAAAMGVALGAKQIESSGAEEFERRFNEICDTLASTRPTAVNLFWAIERMKRVFRQHAETGDLQKVRHALEAEAVQMHAEDIALNRRMGSFGAGLLGERVLTHCNAGALATAGYGTALGRHPCSRRARKKDSGVRRRNTPLLARGEAHSLGAAKGQDSSDSHHRQYGRLFHATGED